MATCPRSPLSLASGRAAKEPRPSVPGLCSSPSAWRGRGGGHPRGAGWGSRTRLAACPAGPSAKRTRGVPGPNMVKNSRKTAAVGSSRGRALRAAPLPTREARPDGEVAAEMPEGQARWAQVHSAVPVSPCAPPPVRENGARRAGIGTARGGVECPLEGGSSKGPSLPEAPCAAGGSRARLRLPGLVGTSSCHRHPGRYRAEGWGHLIRIPCPENTRAASQPPPRGRACVLMPGPTLGLLLTGTAGTQDDTVPRTRAGPLISTRQQ